MADHCPKSGGTWPAVQTFVAFLLTNIFAHAATSRTSTGAKKLETLLTFVAALFVPVLAGRNAFIALTRWVSRAGQVGIWKATGGDSFETAIMAGAVAIYVPLKYAGMVKGRWQQLLFTQNAIYLDHSPVREKRLDRNNKRYYCFILPPKATIPAFKARKTFPSSSSSGPAIALIQVGFGVHQLYSNYASSVSQGGLSSPYIVLIPYILMSVVNLVSGMLVPMYTHVHILPMAVDRYPERNIVVVVEQSANNRFPLGIISGPDTVVTELGARLKGDLNHKDVGDKVEILTGDHWVEIPVNPQDVRNTLDGQLEEAVEKAIIPIFNLRIFCLRREEYRTSTCIDIKWILHWGNCNHPKMLRPPGWTPPKSIPRQNLLLMKKGWYFEGAYHRKTERKDENSKWELIQSVMPNERKTEFQAWLSQNYPDLNIPLDRMPTPEVRIQWMSIFYLNITVTIVLAGLTRFRADSVTDAAWQLIWIYGATVIFLLNSGGGKYHSLIRYAIAVCAGIVFPVIGLGGVGGIVVAVTSLYGDICGTPVGVSPWIMLGYTCAIPAGYFVLTVIAYTGYEIFYEECLNFRMKVFLVLRNRRR